MNADAVGPVTLLQNSAVASIPHWPTPIHLAQPPRPIPGRTFQHRVDPYRLPNKVAVHAAHDDPRMIGALPVQPPEVARIDHHTIR